MYILKTIHLCFYINLQNKRNIKKKKLLIIYIFHFQFLRGKRRKNIIGIVNVNNELRYGIIYFLLLSIALFLCKYFLYIFFFFILYITISRIKSRHHFCVEFISFEAAKKLFFFLCMANKLI